MIDYDRVAEEVIGRAARGVMKATEFALTRAEEHAPVRALFKGRRRGPAYSGKRPALYGDPVNRKFAGDRPMRTKKQHDRFLASKQRNRKVSVEHGRRSMLGDSDAMVTPQQQKLGQGLQDLPESVRGHPNSIIPVRKTGKWRLTGDFRKFDKKTGGLATVPAVSQTRGIGGKRTVSTIIPINATSRLTAAGKREVARAKGAHPASALYKGRIGGRLRGELRMSQQVREGDEIWYYVESPTPYAIYQEFGTTKHRAQPFLRPALYESRGALRYEVRRAVDSSFAAPGVRSKNKASVGA